MDLLAPVICWALVYLLTIELIRAFPWPRRWTQKRPLSCDVCMSSWLTIGHSALVWDSPQGLVTAMAAGGLALLTLIVLITPRRGPPSWD